MAEPLTLSSLLGAATGLAALQFLVGLWLAERFKAKLQLESAGILESIRWETRVREQAAKVAEYMALARELGDKTTPDEYRRANQLAWELALWMPAQTYRNLSRALTSPDETTNPLSVIAEVRHLLLEGKLGALTQNEVIHHGPGIGRIRSIAEQR